MSRPILNLLVALHSEARPLIDHYKLVKYNAAGVHCYIGETKDCKLHLVVTGIGRVNMAAACAWLAAHNDDRRSAWLNVGTAGHRDCEVGTPLRVAYAEGEPSGRSHYPPLVVPWSQGLGQLRTADHVCSDYPEQALVDMEGSAFFATALRFASAELVQAIKVVSDNENNSIDQLNAARLTELIAVTSGSIIEFAQNLVELAETMPESTVVGGMFEAQAQHLHVTASQHQQLLDLGQKLLNCGVDLVRLEEDIERATQTKKLIYQWQQSLSSIAPKLGQLP